MIKKILFSICIIFVCTNANAKRTHSERYYQQRECKGVMEYKLYDNTRVDCLTDEYAIEFDFADKWAEAIGQSLHYGRMTGKAPGIYLIIEKESDMKYYHTLMHNIAIYKLPIKTWIVQ